MPPGFDCLPEQQVSYPRADTLEPNRTSVLPLAVDALEQRKLRVVLRKDRHNRQPALEFLESFGKTQPPQWYDFSPTTSQALLAFQMWWSSLSQTLLVADCEWRIRAWRSRKAQVHSPHIILHRARASRKSILLCGTGLRDWELEEFLCVWRYLTEKVRHFLKQVEDDYMAEYMVDEPFIVETHYVDSRWESDDMFFSEDFFRGGRQEWVEGCLTRGLVQLKKMVTAEDRFEVLESSRSSGNALKPALSMLRPHAYHPKAFWLGTWRLGGGEGFNDLLKNTTRADCGASDIGRACRLVESERESVERRTRRQEQQWEREGKIYQGSEHYYEHKRFEWDREP
ncbi:hypothetical protein AJ80_07030 [Polytolypa hystricis UAMH7299]|uniref:Uncharacterized protein n=1 Tax=Polytolypa hystricis (strain UAMH7299) TaxID=1447883 RepID=A0A2B7XSC0_POLH7|nr:hypothetical protein AJ80_07030 [Polytolypa hystricis UAMH7299]